MSKEKQPKDPAEQGNEIKTAADLIQDENNYRKHSETNKARIRKSIDEAGLGRSVVIDADGVLVAGNGVQQVIDKDTPVKVVETDGTELVVVKRTDLHTGDPRRKTLALADNATADDVEWDFEAIEADGWTEESAGGWGVEWPADEEKGEQQEAQEDDFDPDSVTDTICKKGDIWKLGNHRLMCGDSCDIEQVKKLCGGQQVDCWLTDPPYNVAIGYEGSASEARQRHRKTDQKVMLNDSMPDADFRQFLVKAYTAAKESMNAGAAYYIFHADAESYNFRGALRDVGGMQLRETLIWVKDAFTLGRQDYQWKHEPCLYGWKEGASHKFFNDRKQTTCIEFPRPKRSEEHPTMKPVPLFAYLMANSTEQGDLVLDSFGGSGTTLIAAEQLNRKCYMMELDPHYCDVIIARWEKLTGNKAEKLK